MVSLLQAALAYSFAAGTRVDYAVTIDFDGFLPVFGGKEARANVSMVVRAVAVADRSVESEIQSLKVTLNGALMPINEKNIRTFFPKAIAKFDAFGKVTANTAPNVPPLVRLPGLDAQRLPEITYLPLELPKSDQVYTFERTIGGAEVEYVVTPSLIDAKLATFSFRFKQRSTTFEDARANLMKREVADVEVVSEFAGTGTADFNRVAGRIDRLDLTGETVDRVTDLKSQSVTNRRLRTKLAIRAKAP